LFDAKEGRAQALKNAAIIAASDAAGPAPPPAAPKKIPPKAVKKDVKSLLKGVVVKKKPKPTDAAPIGEEPKMAMTIPAQPVAAGLKREADNNEEPFEGKKQKIDQR